MVGMDDVRMEKLVEGNFWRGKRENPIEEPAQILISPPRTPRGVTETRTRDSSDGGQAFSTVWLRSNYLN